MDRNEKYNCSSEYAFWCMSQASIIIRAGGDGPFIMQDLLCNEKTKEFLYEILYQNNMSLSFDLEEKP